LLNKDGRKRIFYWVDYLRRSPFVRNVSIVMSGTAVSQVISFALTPIISRLFSPADFGVLGSFSSVLGVVVAGVTLQYSQAIMLPKEDRDAANVFAVSLLSVALITCLSIAAAVLFSDRLLSLLNATQAGWLLWLLPLGILVSGLNQTFQAWCVRKKAFKATASSHVIRAGFAGALQIVAGFFKAGGAGLAAGAVAADGIALLNLSSQVLGTDKKLIKGALCRRSLVQKAIEYRDFPLYSATQNIMSSLSMGLPVLLLAHFFGIAAAGSYAFGLKLLQVPMNFILTALRQVLFQKATETYNQNGDILLLFKKITVGLFFSAIIPAFLFFLFAPALFVWCFGDNWFEAGIFVRWLIIWQVFQFCNVPSVLYARILRLQKKMFVYETLILFTRTACLIIGGIFFSINQTIGIFSVAGALLNIAMIFWIWKILNTKLQKGMLE